MPRIVPLSDEQAAFYVDRAAAEGIARTSVQPGRAWTVITGRDDVVRPALRAIDTFNAAANASCCRSIS